MNCKKSMNQKKKLCNLSQLSFMTIPKKNWFEYRNNKLTKVNPIK